MSVKEPWDDSWKTRCRARIKSCDGAIVLVSKNSAKADGQRWEAKAIKEEGVPRLGIYTTAENRPATMPTEFSGMSVKAWSWDNISSFLRSL
jgi:hypothetical protein